MSILPCRRCCTPKKTYSLVTPRNSHVLEAQPGWQPDNDEIALMSRMPPFIISEEEISTASKTVTSADFIYHFYSQSNPEHSLMVRTTSIRKLINSPFDKDKDTLFIFHGWRGNEKSEVNCIIREAVLMNHDINLFVIDWSVIAGRPYRQAVASVVKAGEFIADFIRGLQFYYDLSLKKVKFVGHSLGAHVCGTAGHALNGDVDRITGLDPAGPFFTLRKIHNRLKRTDAQYVQIIHTNDGRLGLKGLLGHADFYPNGGRKQPGCGLDLTGSDSHSRSFEYYKESLVSDQFIARQCASYKDYCQGKYLSAIKAVMGRFHPDKKIRGRFFLETNKKAPFARGDQWG